jgi:hypothetical protein
MSTDISDYTPANNTISGSYFGGGTTATEAVGNFGLGKENTDGSSYGVKGSFGVK